MDPLPDVVMDLVPGEVIDCGQAQLEIRFVPGHAPGHVAFVCHEHGWTLGGDVLFEGSIGRTDLPGSHAPDLVTSILTQFYTLPDDMVARSQAHHRGRKNRSLLNAAGSGLLQREAER